jgi:hypothetical protein
VSVTTMPDDHHRFYMRASAAIRRFVLDATDSRITKRCHIATCERGNTG